MIIIYIPTQFNIFFFQFYIFKSFTPLYTGLQYLCNIPSAVFRKIVIKAQIK